MSDFDDQFKKQRRGNTNRGLCYEQSPGKSNSPRRDGRSPRGKKVGKQFPNSGFTLTNSNSDMKGTSNGNLRYTYDDSNGAKYKRGHYGQGNQMHSRQSENSQVGQPAFREPDPQSAEVDEINVAALRRLDPAFKQLYGTTSQVAIYDFDSETKNWKQSDCAGCFFLYARSEPPRYGFVVMNRMNLDNLMQTFDLDTEVQSLPPYILLRNKETISCVWFYYPEECTRFTSIMCGEMGLAYTPEEGSLTTKYQSTGRAGDGQQQPGKYQKQSTGASSIGVGGQGLLSMLVSGLKLENHKSGGAGVDQPTKQEKPAAESKRKSVLTLSELEEELRAHAPVAAPQTEFDGSYLDLRLFAGGASAPYFGGYLGQNLATQKPSGFVPVQTNTVSTHFNDIYSQLQVSFTNAAGPHDVAIAGRMQTVEQLERDMRSQELQVEDAKELEQDLRRKLGIGPSSRHGSDSSNVVDTFSNGSRKASGGESLLSSLRGSNELSAKSPFLTPMTPQSRSESDSRRSERERTADDLVGQALIESDIEVVREVFQNGTGQDLCLIPIDTPQEKQRLHWAKKNRNTIANTQIADMSQGQFQLDDCRISPLSKEQLQQGLIHLLKTDASFIVKLHEAYVDSLNSSLRKD